MSWPRASVMRAPVCPPARLQASRQRLHTHARTPVCIKVSLRRQLRACWCVRARAGGACALNALWLQVMCNIVMHQVRDKRASEGAREMSEKKKTNKKEEKKKRERR